ncbi:hypothetical protein [Methylocapsa aurea]|uniref:hypothetical protein n=1 Tax=Methylocapsa aurea TaxID=663610 RepID=UPI003D18ABCA
MKEAVMGNSDTHNVLREVSIPFERKGEPGVWSIEEIGPDGEIHQAIFIGPEAKERCEEYAAFKYAAQ